MTRKRRRTPSDVHARERARREAGIARREAAGDAERIAEATRLRPKAMPVTEFGVHGLDHLSGGSDQGRMGVSGSLGAFGTVYGPGSRPEEPKPVVVELGCMVDDDPQLPEDQRGAVWWHAEWGLEDDSVGYEHSSDDLAELIELVVQDTRQWAVEGHLNQIDWHTRESDGLDADDEIAAAGLILPDRPDVSWRKTEPTP